MFHCRLEDNFFLPTELVRGLLYTDYSVELHTHAFYEMNIILSGTGMHIIEENEFEVFPGNVFMIPPQVIHGYQGTKDLNVFHILLQPLFIKQFTQDSGDVDGFTLLMEIEPYLRSNFKKPLFLRLSAMQMLEIKYDLDILTMGGSYDYPGSQPLKKHTALKLLYYLSHMISEQAFGKAINSSPEVDRSIMHTLEFIHKNYGERLSIDDLCNEAFMARSSYLRHFKAYCGCTPMRYLYQYRCNKAKELLAENKLKKTEIAQMCGFYDLSHMKKKLSE